MSKVYVAKVNLTSQISSIYEKGGRNKVIQKIYNLLKNESTYIHKYVKRIKGKYQSCEEQYTLTVIAKNDDNYEIEGILMREAVISYKTRDRRTGKKYTHTPTAVEEIEFLYSIKKERIAFTTKRRFKHKQFICGMAGIINKCMEMAKEPYAFTLSIYRTGISVDKIKQELKKLGSIQELSISYQVPNPDDEDYEDMIKNPEEFINRMNDAQVDDMSHIFRSSHGVNIESKVISDNLNMVKKMHSTLDQKKAYANGYAKVIAINNRGLRYSTEEDNIFSRNMKVGIERFGFYRETINMTIGEENNAKKI